MQRTVALTGISGFIGQAIAHHLCQAGVKVRGLIRTSKKIASLEHPDITLINGNLDNRESLNRLVEGCSSLINCAGAIRGYKKDDFSPTNIRGVDNLLQVCLSQPLPPKFIHLSSLAAREPALSPYAWSKREGELIIQQQAQTLPWIILRPPAVYGPNDEALLPLFKLARKGIAIQLGTRDAKFSLIHVQDLADVTLRCIESHNTRSKTFDVDDGLSGGYSWESVFRVLNPHMKIHLQISPTLLWLLGKSNEVFSRLLRYAPLFTTGKVAELRHHDWVCDSLDSRQQLDWTPQIPLEEGLRRLFTSDNLIVSKMN